MKNPVGVRTKLSEIEGLALDAHTYVRDKNVREVIYRRMQAIHQLVKELREDLGLHDQADEAPELPEGVPAHESAEKHSKASKGGHNAK